MTARAANSQGVHQADRDGNRVRWPPRRPRTMTLSPVLFHPAQQSSHLPRRQPQFLRRVGLLDQLLEADGTEGAFIEARRRTRLLDQAPILTLGKPGARLARLVFQAIDAS